MIRLLQKHWCRLKRSASRRIREQRLPRGYRGLGMRRGGWEVNARLSGSAPLPIDCGLDEDIEGAEYEVLHRLCSSGEIRTAGQVRVEFRHKVTRHTLADTQRTAVQMQRSGFRGAHRKDRNYIFGRRDRGC